MSYEIKSGRDKFSGPRIIVIGSGVAGLFASLNLTGCEEVLVFTKGGVRGSNSYYAQGGLAAAVEEPDTPEKHLEDTLAAGAGLCDKNAVQVLVNEGKNTAYELDRLGVEFDRGPEGFSLTLEGAHSCERVLRAHGDATGRVISEQLEELVRQSPLIKMYEDRVLLDFLIENGRCCGVVIWNTDLGKAETYYADAVILASGGAGHVFAETSNYSAAVGDGVALGYRAGAEIKDIEFYQFHPTALMMEREEGKRFLISEAVRGEGGILRNTDGEPFMRKYHERKDLAPRDIVSRAIWREMEKTGHQCVYLDVTKISKDYFKKRFPTIFSKCYERGVDIAKEYIPVAPAAHYMMGGLKTSMEGETSIGGLYACGEVACTGVHGANRLASNSLLEALVFSKKAAIKAGEMVNKSFGSQEIDNDYPEDFDEFEGIFSEASFRLEKLRNEISHTMWSCVGIVRDAESIKRAENYLKFASEEIKKYPNTIERKEVENIIETALLIVKSAFMREESRGAHYRSDFEETEPEWRRHIVLSREGVRTEEVDD